MCSRCQRRERRPQRSCRRGLTSSFRIPKLLQMWRVFRMIGEPSCQAMPIALAGNEKERVDRRGSGAIWLGPGVRDGRRLRWRFAGVPPSVARVGELPLPDTIGRLEINLCLELLAKKFPSFAAIDH